MVCPRDFYSLVQRPLDASLAIDKGEPQPDPSLAMLAAASFLPGSSDQVETYVQPPALDPPSPHTASNMVSMRGAVLEVGRVPSNGITHPTIEETGDISSSMAGTLKGNFTLRGQLMHVFVSYRVETEGGAGNGLSGSIAERIRALSLDSRQELRIPQHGTGIWPKGIKKPEPFRPEEAKVFLDKDCLQVIGRLLPRLSLPKRFYSQGTTAAFSRSWRLAKASPWSCHVISDASPLQDGQSWLSGFITGVVTSMVNPFRNHKPETMNPKAGTRNPKP